MTIVGARRARRVVALLALAALLGTGACLVAASGVVPIAASAGHWPVTAWLLHFSMRRSVTTHSLGVHPPPSLEDPALVLLGAGHYEGGCRPCHGAPGSRRPVVPAAMTPPPPSLVGRAGEWSAAQLFYIVEHGVKFTGMPAWPVRGRHDEVWAVVAFLRVLPDLDAEGYAALVHGGHEHAHTHGDAAEPGAGRPVVPGVVRERCARCHADDGSGRGAGAFPRLTGQRPAYLRNALEAYARGMRRSGVMQPIASQLERHELELAVDHYAAAVAPHAASDHDPDLIARGERLARAGAPIRRIPPCVECHGPIDRARKAAYPSLAAQPARYLALQLELFAADRRGGSEHAHLMQPIATRLTTDERRAVAAYYASLPPG